jgi:hypothetical protein
MADPPVPTLATADPVAPTPSMADRAPVMVDPTDVAPGMAPATTCCRRASRYSASSSTAGTEGLRRALGRSPAMSTHHVRSPMPSFPFLLRETELPNPNVSYFCYLCLRSAPPFVSPRRDPYGATPSILPDRAASALPCECDSATASVPRATVCCLRIRGWEWSRGGSRRARARAVGGGCWPGRGQGKRRW